MEWDWENLDIFSSKAVTIASPKKLQSTEDNVAGGSPPSFELEGSVCSSGQSIGLKLGKRTYFGNNFGNNSTKTCNSPNVSVSTVKKVKLSQQSTPITWCQVEGCNLDLSSSKEYHRKHKVCEIHSKSLKVVVAGLERRFCQQCSRFHGLAEFDGIKRSCRRRLSDHNARRRKPQQDTIKFNSTTLSSSFYDRQQQQQQQQLSFVFNNVPSVKTGDQFPNAVCTAGVFYQGSNEGVDLRRALSLLSNSSWGPDFSGLDHHSISTTNGPTMAAHHGSPPGYWQLNHQSVDRATQFQESQVLKPPYGMQYINPMDDEFLKPL